MKPRWIVASILFLALGVVGLGTALAVVVATDDDSDAQASADDYAGCQMAWGMMAGRGSWTPGTMRSHMQGVLGQEGYQRMLDYMRAYANGQDVSRYPDAGPMWMMMGSMMSGWTRDDFDRCWDWMLR